MKIKTYVHTYGKIFQSLNNLNYTINSRSLWYLQSEAFLNFYNTFNFFQ